MGPQPGTNYPIADQGLWFWVIFLSIAVVATVVMIGVFLIAVARDGELVHRTPADEPKQLPRSADRPAIQNPHAA